MFNLFRNKLPLITDEEAQQIKKKIKKFHYWFDNESLAYNIKNALSSMYYNGLCNRRSRNFYNNFYQEYHAQALSELNKLRRYYERGKLIRKEQNREICRLRSKVKRLQTNRQTKLEAIGDIMQRLNNGTSVYKNHNGDWCISLYIDGEDRIHVDSKIAPDGIFTDLLAALSSIDKPMRK